MRLLTTASALVLVACAAAAAIWFRPDKTLRVTTGLVSHSMCSQTFITGRDPAAIRREFLAPMPGIGTLLPLMTVSVDTDRQTVSASIGGLFASRAAYHKGFGCSLIYDRDVVAGWPAPPAVCATDPATDIAGPAVVEPASSALKAALDRAFAEPASGPQRATKAVVIVHDGKIIAERYADGYGIDTPFMSWSVAKSVTNALLGVLVQQGKLKLDAPAPIAEWQGANDPRRAITIAQLMRMTSGLDIDETNTGFDVSPRMLYTEPDMAAAVARAGLIASPGTRWHYSSPSTLLLSRIIRDQAGGGATDVINFAQRELFGPLGMRNVTMEFDSAGTPIGSTYMYAPARDWARLGLLYLNDGVVGARRILPEGWVNFSATEAPGRGPDGYAAGFFTNRGDAEYAQRRVRGGMPPDSFFASGTLGQRVIVAPSERLVIVSFGYAQDWPIFDMVGAVHLTRDAIAACAQEGC
jgi:hypothetical protein